MFEVSMANAGFSKWYQENRARLSQQRKDKYKHDPAYREAVLQRSRNYRKARREAQHPAEYVYTFVDVAARLEITIWTLREWRRNDYFPEPKSIGGKLWFTENQVLLLSKLKEVTESIGARMSERTKPRLEAAVATIYANWL